MVGSISSSFDVLGYLLSTFSCVTETLVHCLTRLVVLMPWSSCRVGIFWTSGLTVELRGLMSSQVILSNSSCTNQAVLRTCKHCLEEIYNQPFFLLYLEDLF